MFLFEVNETYPELIIKARKALSFDELVTYLAGCKDLPQAFSFLTKFDWNHSARTASMPDVVMSKVHEQWTENYAGYTEKTSYFSGIVNGNETDGTLTIHHHENGNIEYFLSWK